MVVNNCIVGTFAMWLSEAILNGESFAHFAEEHIKSRHHIGELRDPSHQHIMIADREATIAENIGTVRIAA